MIGCRDFFFVAAFFFRGRCPLFFSFVANCPAICLVEWVNYFNSRVGSIFIGICCQCVGAMGIHWQPDVQKTYNNCAFYDSKYEDTSVSPGGGAAAAPSLLVSVPKVECIKSTPTCLEIRTSDPMM